MKQYNDKQIIRKIINYKFNFSTLNARKFPQLVHGTGLYCDWHPNSRTGTQHARLYYNEDKNIWYIHCYVCGRNYYASDYVEAIMCKEKQLYKSPKDFLLTKLSNEEFISLYNLFQEKKQAFEENAWKKKCEWIDNTYNETGNIIDYIEALYTA